MSTASTQARILRRIAELSADVSALRRVRMEIASSGTASASLSSGGGSKSFTRLDLASVSSAIVSLENEIVALRRRLAGASPISRIMITRA